MYSIVMFTAKWDRQIKVYVYFKNNIVRDIIPKSVLKIQLCEKYKISGMLPIYRITICATLFVNKWSMNEYDSFQNVPSNINYN